MNVLYLAMRVVVFVTFFASASTGLAQQSSGTSTERAARIGVYDSRAVAIAYAGSSIQQQRMTALKAAHQRAKDAGDSGRDVAPQRRGKGAASGAAQTRIWHRAGRRFARAHCGQVAENTDRRGRCASHFKVEFCRASKTHAGGTHRRHDAIGRCFRTQRQTTKVRHRNSDAPAALIHGGRTPPPVRLRLLVSTRSEA